MILRQTNDDRCVCPVCGYVSKWKDCDKVHITCPICRKRPRRITPCCHLGATVRNTKAGECRKKFLIYKCKLFGEVTTDCEIPLTPCCRTCGEYEAGTPTSTSARSG